MSKDILPDDLLKEALRKAQEMKTSAYDKEIAQEEEHVFSKEYREKMEKLLEEFENKQEDKEEKKNHVVKKKNLKLKILLIAAIVMLMGSMTVMAVEPLREVFYQLIEKIFPDNTEVNFEEISLDIEEKSKGISPDNFEIKELQEVPEKYKLDYEEYIEIMCDYTKSYISSEGKTLIYQQCAIGYFDTWSISSNGESAKCISINGEVGYILTDENGYNTILYPCEGYVFALSGFEEIEVLVKMLETIF